MSQSIVITHRRDKFRTGRITAIQPPFTSANFAESVMQTTDPMAVAFMTNLLRLWALERPDLPPDFVDEVGVTELSRQPAAFVRIELEVVKRTLALVSRPYEGGPIDSASWHTDDPFELLPLRTGLFLSENLTDSARVPGAESVEPCRQCNQAGAVRCESCAGGSVPCPTCGGTTTVTCTRCAGSGQHIGARGNPINCELCRTRGTLRCDNCRHGQVSCSHCRGKGMVQCDPCGGHGNMLTFWYIQTEHRTETSQFSNSAEAWPFDQTSLIDDSTQLDKEVWRWPLVSAPERPLTAWMPPELAAAVQSRIDNHTDGFDAHSQNERPTAIRVTLFGSYLYSVEFDCGQEPERVYIGGLSNCIFSARDGGPKKRGLLGLISKLGYHVVNAIGNIKPPVDKSYLKAVHANSVHIGDTRCVVPQAIQMIGQECRITERGYELRPDSNPKFPVELEIDFNALGVPLLCIRRNLGAAERQQFARALQLNRQLSFGRICLLNEGDGYFCLIDRRQYKYVSSDHLAKILTGLIAESDKIISSQMLY